MQENPNISVLESQIRECYGRIVWTHKTHEKCADILNSRDGHIKIAQIILSALVTSGIIASLFNESKEVISGITAIISLILLILNTYMRKYDLGGSAQKHVDAAVSLWNIRESYLSLLTDIKSEGIDEKEIRKIRDKLQNDLHKIYKGSPRTISKAYAAASKSLKEMEEMTLSDEEINKFLPVVLHKNSNISAAIN